MVRASENLSAESYLSRRFRRYPDAVQTPKPERYLQGTPPPPKEIFLENLASKKIFHAGGRHKNPIKTRRTVPTTESFLCGFIPFRKEKLCTGLHNLHRTFLFHKLSGVFTLCRCCVAPPFVRNFQVHFSQYLLDFPFFSSSI